MGTSRNKRKASRPSLRTHWSSQDANSSIRITTSVIEAGMDANMVGTGGVWKTSHSANKNNTNVWRPSFGRRVGHRSKVALEGIETAWWWRLGFELAYLRGARHRHGSSGQAHHGPSPLNWYRRLGMKMGQALVQAEKHFTNVRNLPKKSLAQHLTQNKTSVGLAAQAGMML